MEYPEQVRVLKAFCDENRLRILDLLRDGEKCACVLLDHLDLGQSGLSYHMKILVESGVVKSRGDGKWTHYSIDPQGGACALSLIEQLTSPSDVLRESQCCSR